MNPHQLDKKGCATTSPRRWRALQSVMSVAVLFSLTILLASSMLSCGKKEAASSAKDDVLLSVGDSTLRMSDVMRQIPVGLDAIDSVRMFRNIVDSWLSGLVMADIAEKNIPNMSRIDKMVEEYRNNLVINEYMKLLAERVKVDVPEDSIKAYYNSHLSDFELAQPLIKGMYIRVDENDSQLPNLRKWISQFTDDAFDKIEGQGLRHATAYEYFPDHWYEWSEVAGRIPYRFFDPDAFVRSTTDFETSADGSVYLLHISDRVLTGQVMPYEYARLKILELMRSAEINSVRSKVKLDVYKRMINEGVIKTGLYDPLKGEMKTKENDKS